MKYCFIGLGSIAKKHIANIRIIDKESIIHAYRSNKSSSGEVSPLVDKEIYDFNLLDDKYDVVFITNPTSLHFDTLNRFYDKSNSFFIEKPVFDIYKNEEELKKFINKKTYIAAPLRYSAGVSYMKELIETKGKPISLRIISSSYLPEWRPNVDYRNIYSARKDLGGGVHIDLIHELDYLTYLVGAPEKSYYLNDKVSSLEIDSYDLSISIHKIKNIYAEIHLDYFGRDKKRICELYYNDSVYYVDLIANKVQIKSNNENKQLTLDSKDMYYGEMNYFLDYIKSNEQHSDNDILLANKVLKIINEGDK